MIEITVDRIGELSQTLRAGDKVELSGYIYTARDQAHIRILAMIKNGETLPFDLKGAVIYYAGPSPAPKNFIIGSCGPTTSGRMDKFTPTLLDRGLGGMIGKGERSVEVINSIIRNKSIYFAAIGGAGALAALSVKSSEVIAFPELECESIKKLYVEKFSLITAIDCFGGNIYERN